MWNIKNIIFDYGGVILDIDYYKTVEAFRDLGVRDFNLLYSQALQTDFFDLLEKGKVNAQDFYRFIRKISQMDLTNDQIKKAWNAIILTMPEHRIRLLEQVRKNYRIFLLSNTNVIHYEVYTKQLRDVFGYKGFNELFEKAYLSFQIGMKKPDLEFFELVLSENKLNASETLFIDDSIQQVQGAEKAGLITYHLAGYKDITELFDANYKLINPSDDKVSS